MILTKLARTPENSPLSKRTLIIGAGSIGQRHLDVLNELGNDCAFVTQRVDLPDATTYKDLEPAIIDFAPDFVVIANETSKHAETIRALSTTRFIGKVLVEKPLNAQEIDVSELPFEKVGVAFNLRFHPIILRIKEILASQEVFSVNITAGQHLSTWRPTRSLSRQYSTQKSMGGGVLRDLSHEFDYSQQLFGNLELVSALGGRLGDVTQDSDDSWAILAKTNSVPQISIQLSYLDHVPVRQIRIVTKEMTIAADLIHGTLSVGADTEVFTIERNDTYKSMHENFLADGETQVTNLLEAQRTDLFISAIEKQSLGLEKENR